MKKIFCLFVLLVSILTITSCDSKDEKFIDHISFVLNEKTIELKQSMSGRDVFKTIYKELYKGNSNYSFSITPNYLKAYQREDSTLITKRSKNDYLPSVGLYNENSTQTFQTLYKRYSAFYPLDEEREVKFFEITRNQSLEKNDSKEEENEYIKFYGESTTLNSQDDGYIEGSLEKHYVEKVYYDTNMYGNETKKENYAKYYNDLSDLYLHEYGKPSFKEADVEIIEDIIYFQPTIYMIDEYDGILSEFVTYTFSLTDKHIILNYKLDFPFEYIWFLYNADLSDEILTILREYRTLGDSYSLVAYLNYQNICSDDSGDYINADHIHIESVSVMKRTGSYPADYSNPDVAGKEYDLYEKRVANQKFDVLDLSLEEVEKLKNTLISSTVSNSL